ncbi:hypothetical protein ACQR1Y_12270 [Bradyrhizobium sp. HKCCYLRH3099]|uniref:hypothetical protein n=1 Tax=unclassified Bradyrhizobium TaxID=2631580 RepID=UPI003EBC8BFA
MRYVRIKPAADSERSACGRLIFIECGAPCENGHPPRFVLHEGEEQWLPAWAAAELAERGHEILEFSEVRNGAHVPLKDVSADDIDPVAEIDKAPVHEVDRFLRHHGRHDHLAAAQPQAAVRSNLKGVTARLGPALPISARELRSRAKDACRQHQARRAQARAARQAQQPGAAPAAAPPAAPSDNPRRKS